MPSLTNSATTQTVIQSINILTQSLYYCKIIIIYYYAYSFCFSKSFYSMLVKLQTL